MTAARPEYDVVVVGAGTNGLTAAARLARAGHKVLVVERAGKVGGSCASDTFGGLVRDTCAAIHPFGAASPAFHELKLHEHGLAWTHPPVAVAHPLDDGRAATLELNPADLGARYDRTIGALVRRGPAALDALTGPIVRVPRTIAGVTTRLLLGSLATAPATVVARAMFPDDHHRALWTGIAAHATTRLDTLWSNAPVTGLMVAGDVAGWPAAEGGSQRISDALAAVVEQAGGAIELGVDVTDVGQLPSASATLLDVTPRQAVRLANARIPDGRARRALERWRYGPGHCKVDYVLSGPMPWTAEACHRAGTVHLGGTMAEIATAEADVVAGRRPDRPYVLVVQPDVADPTRRGPNGERPLWAYTHTAAGADVDATAAMERQFDRFAPGWRDLVVAAETRTARQAEAHNPNLVGGDISGGSVGGRQLLARPRLAPDPYRIAGTDLWLCSGATAPGPGVHGMAGWHAAARVQQHLEK